MGQEYVMNAISEIETLARKEGLDFFPTIFELVDKNIMLEGCSYGLPVRARHWSYGRSYQHQRLYGEMGFSKVYEIVFNNDPSYAFLLNTNPDIINIMVGAHVFGHVHFFKHNVMFKGSDRSMIYRAAERATRVDNYIEKYGLEKVEHIMDIGFALDNHIDWHKGLFREKYAGKQIVERISQKGEFDDLINKKKTRSIQKGVIGNKLPPHPEKDILWFLINYAPLENWERDIFSMIREESYYFYPIVVTKIMNEGFASFWHAELMYKYSNLSEQEYLDFAKTHAGVINPGNTFNINPYYLGFKIFTDIRERWDKLHSEGKSSINGIQKVIEVAAGEDDASFLRNYLTVELAEKIGLFNYGYRLKRNPEDKQLTEEHGIIELKDRDLNKIIDNIIRPTNNYGAPLITIDQVDGDTLILRHRDNETLDEKYMEKTMEYLFNVWGGPIELKTMSNGKYITYDFDESGFDLT
ncbi:MAG: SpoVR family protein [Patescibacteria group bacterium]